MLPLNDLLQLANLNKTELSISGIQGADAVIPHKFYKCPSPHNFVRAIKDAKLFVTNSYHGTLLAIMLHTPFITIAQEGITASQNTRQEELLTWLNLREHMIKSNELCDMGVSIFNQKVNWGYVDKLLVQYRQESLNW